LEEFPKYARTKILISLSASVAVNCIPCFEHFPGKTQAVRLTPEEIQETLEIADKVKNGARITALNTIRGMIGVAASLCADNS
jgi:hypothetical protein